MEAARADAEAAQGRLTDLRRTAEVPFNPYTPTILSDASDCTFVKHRLGVRTPTRYSHITCRFRGLIAADRDCKSWRVWSCRSSSERRPALRRRAAAASRRRRRSCRPPSSRCYTIYRLSAGCRLNMRMPQPLPAWPHITASCHKHAFLFRPRGMLWCAHPSKTPAADTCAAVWIFERSHFQSRRSPRRGRR